MENSTSQFFAAKVPRLMLIYEEKTGQDAIKRVIEEDLSNGGGVRAGNCTICRGRF